MVIRFRECNNALFLISVLLFAANFCAVTCTKSKTNTNMRHTSAETGYTNSSISWNSQKQYFFAYGNCNDLNCKDPYGVCTETTVCSCYDGYAQPRDQEVSDDAVSCTYLLKEQYLAFLLEFLFWVGAGHFYCGRIVNGVGKLGFVCFVIIFDCFLKKMFKPYENKNRRTFNNFAYFLYFCLLFWQIFDVVMFGLNKYNDGNYMPLHTWDST